jgi:hypothetical protein
MPWKVYQEDNKFCVHKLNGDDTKGAKVPGGCHSSREDASRHMRALYASEGKSKKENGMSDTGVLDKIVGFIDGLRKKETKESNADTGLLLFKGKDDRLRFLVRYSNKFRDDDFPVKEIISDNSHRRFDEMVDKGTLPMPNLWIWHVPEWKFGEADWHAYDDSGFAMASGLVDKGKEPVALWLSKQKGVRTSHGMPPASIVRDPEDPSVIIEHQTVEISVLPEDSAANKMTGFYILGNESKEAGMGVPAEKLTKLLEKWDASEDLLKELESVNAADAERADAMGVESKEAGKPETDQPETKEEDTEEQTTVETTEDVVETKVEEEPVSETKVEEEPQADEDADIANKATGDGLTREEIAKAVVDAVRPIMKENRKLTEEVAQLRKEVTHLKEKDDDKIEKAIGDTPPASVSALIARSLSASHSKETEIDGRTTLAKSKPKEADVQPDNVTGIGFLDRMLSDDSRPQ